MSTKTRLIIIAVVIVVLLVALMARNKVVQSSENRGEPINTAISVSTVTASKQPVDDRFSVVGTVNAYNDVVVLSEAQGRIVKVNAEIGDYKSAGSVLVEVDSELKEAAYKAATVTYEKAKRDLERSEALYKEHSISDTQVEQARWSYQSTEAQYIVARRQFNDTKITTPISGIVTARMVNVGTMVMGAPQATAVANVVDISRVKVKVSVAEKDLAKLKHGDLADVTTDLYSQEKFSGTILSIASKGDEAHTYPVEVLLNNPKQLLKAGMFVSVTFKATGSQPTLMLPRKALVGSAQNAQVYVIQDNIARLRPVTAGRQTGTEIEITSGISEGEVVVVDGQNNLSDNLQVVVRK
jgi:RND family efflux transporter MFP subunit